VIANSSGLLQGATPSRHTPDQVLSIRFPGPKPDSHLGGARTTRVNDKNVGFQIDELEHMELKVIVGDVDGTMKVCPFKLLRGSNVHNDFWNHCR